MIRTRFLWIASVTLLAASVGAQDILVNRDQEFEPATAVMPYAFYNENLDFGAGPAFIGNGILQDQMALVATGFWTTNNSKAAFLLGFDVDVPPAERLFLDVYGSLGDFDSVDLYVDGNPDFTGERAGSNDSSEDNFIDASGSDSFVQLTWKYLLPMGHARDTVINTYVLDGGLLDEGASGGTGWNPFESGRTYLEIEPFWREQDYSGDFVDSDLETNGLRFGVRWDNTDFVPNPSAGSRHEFSISRDWGKLGSDNSWTFWETNHSLFLSLGESSWFRQTVLALNFWTGDSPTWNTGSGNNRPPLYAGATLGGLWRMRGYPASRFHDKAVIYYAAELRVIPDWNPLGPDSFLKGLEIDWLQLVPFVEVGRVADTWNASELHSDMKWDVGLGLRMLVKKLVIRVDIAVSEEDGGVQMMVGQPF